VSVSNDLRRVKKKIKARGFVPTCGLTVAELHTRSAERTRARLLAFLNGEPAPAEEFLPGEADDLKQLFKPYAAQAKAARDEFLNRIEQMAERRNVADERERQQAEEAKAARLAIVRGGNNEEAAPSGMAAIIRLRRTIP
jgi:Skp family chaperone for outer membrane proteins